MNLLNWLVPNCQPAARGEPGDKTPPVLVEHWEFVSARVTALIHPQGIRNGSLNKKKINMNMQSWQRVAAPFFRAFNGTM